MYKVYFLFICIWVIVSNIFLENYIMYYISKGSLSESCVLVVFFMT